MRILILGGGSREHALAHVLSNSPECEKLYLAPGNAGTAEIALNLDLKENNFQGIKEAVLDKQIDLVIPGPEKPLIEGIVDFFRDDPDLYTEQIVGPDQKAAWLEGSKAFAKDFMKRHQIPTGGYHVFRADQYEEALNTLSDENPPYVIKADGLAAGKGVTICQTKSEGEQTLYSYMVNQSLGEAANQVVIETYLEGVEFSVFVLTDGQNWVTLPDAQDYKRVHDHDQGPNTGGMGAIAPAHNFTEEYRSKVERTIIEPTLQGLQAEDFHYRGFLYFGLIDVEGEPYVLEYNVRLGDPEAAVILPLLASDPLPAIRAVAKGQLNTSELSFKNKAAAAVVMASGGYPGAYEKGKPIHGLEQVHKAHVFHAGTSREGDQIVTAGGRVLAIAALGDDNNDAVGKAYQAVESVDFEQAHYRMDIGKGL